MIKQSLVRMFGRLPFGLRYELFYQAARSLGVESFAAAGPMGSMAGPVWDVTISKSYLQGTVWPREEIALIQSFFASKPGTGTLYDIGANIGMVTISLAQNGVKVVAFEPDSLNCSLLKGNIARNCPSAEITVHQSAVYRENTTLRFAQSSHNSGDHHLDAQGGVAVSAISLDSLPVPSGPLAIKIDTQGAEPGVFEGGRETIAAADMVLSEFWPFGIARMGNKPDAVIETVKTFPHGRIAHAGEPWISGTALADRLHRMCQSLDRLNDTDFVLAREPF